MNKKLPKYNMIIATRGCGRTDMLMSYMAEVYKNTGKKIIYIRKDNIDKKRK